MNRSGLSLGRDRAFPRYLCVGAVCFALNWAMMLLIDQDRYLVSSAICFVAVGSFAYLCHALWTFRSPVNARGLFSYLLGLVPGYPISLALIALFHDVLGIELGLTLPTVTAAMLVINFLVAKFAILGTSSLQSTSQV